MCVWQASERAGRGGAGSEGNEEECRTKRAARAARGAGEPRSVPGSNSARVCPFVAPARVPFPRRRTSHACVLLAARAGRGAEGQRGRTPCRLTFVVGSSYFTPATTAVRPIGVSRMSSQRRPKGARSSSAVQIAGAFAYLLLPLPPPFFFALPLAMWALRESAASVTARCACVAARARACVCVCVGGGSAAGGRCAPLRGGACARAREWRAAARARLCPGRWLPHPGPCTTRRRTGRGTVHTATSARPAACRARLTSPSGTALAPNDAPYLRYSLFFLPRRTRVPRLGARRFASRGQRGVGPPARAIGAAAQKLATMRARGTASADDCKRARWGNSIGLIAMILCRCVA